MNGLTRMYNEDEAFHDAAVEHAMEFTGTTSYAFAHEWLMAEDGETRTEKHVDMPETNLGSDLGTSEVLGGKGSEVRQDVTPSAETDETSNETGVNVTDSDEKLEDDIRGYWLIEFPGTDADEMCELVGGWLERKAELVRKKGQESWIQQANGLITEANLERDRAIEERDMLKERQCPHYHPSEHYCDVHDYDFSENAVSRELARDLQKQNAELVPKVEEQAAEIDALNAELKLARGEVKVVLNNTAAAERRIKSKEAELDRRLALPHDEELTDRLEHAKGTARYYEGEFNRLCGVLLHIQQVARERKVPDANEDDGR